MFTLLITQQIDNNITIHMFLEESNRIELLELALECENKSGI